MESYLPINAADLRQTESSPPKARELTTMSTHARWAAPATSARTARQALRRHTPAVYISSPQCWLISVLQLSLRQRTEISPWRRSTSRNTSRNTSSITTHRTSTTEHSNISTVDGWSLWMQGMMSECPVFGETLTLIEQMVAGGCLFVLISICTRYSINPRTDTQRHTETQTPSHLSQLR